MTAENARTPVRYGTEIGTLFIYIYSMILSKLILGEATSGGSLYMCGRLALMLLADPTMARKEISRTVRIAIKTLAGVLLVINLALISIYPPSAAPQQLWLLFGVIITMMLAETLGRRLIRRALRLHWGRSDLLLRFLVLELTMSLIDMFILAAAVEGQSIPLMIAAYLLGMAISGYTLFKQWDDWQRIPAVDDEQLRTAQTILNGNNTYSIYRVLSGLIVIAMNFTLAMLYTFLAFSAEQTTIAMATAGILLVATRELTELLTRMRSKRKAIDPINQITLGLFLWLYGLLTAERMIRTAPADQWSFFLGIAISTLGVFLCTNCLGRMESVMDRVAQLEAGKPVNAVNRLRAADWEISMMVGQLLVLTALTVLIVLFGQHGKIDVTALQRSFRPLMLIPALIMVLAALLASYRYPLTQRYVNKIGKLLRLQEEGDENPALSKQVETVVKGKRRRPIGTHVLMAVLRPWMRLKLQGTEHLNREDGVPLVYLCNHSEYFGPVAGMLNIPGGVRPWVISEIVNDPEEVAQYTYHYDVSHIKWIPEKWKMPLCRKILGPLSVWGMGQLEAIPVYRNKPTMLMKTMRLSVEALVSGDDLLIFPENPNAVEQDHGYEHEGVGELFSGFAMLAQVYYNKTGKCLHFVPMFCSKKKRTMTFSEQIVYDPDNDPNAERERISTTAENAMRAIYAQEECTASEAE